MLSGHTRQSQTFTSLSEPRTHTTAASRFFVTNMAQITNRNQTAEWVRKIEENSPYGIKGFYRTYAWKKKRLQILARDKHACQECRKQGRYSTAEIVHHIKHLQDEPGLALTDDNLESVCKDCHEKLHPERNREKQSFVNVERW